MAFSPRFQWSPSYHTRNTYAPFPLTVFYRLFGLMISLTGIAIMDILFNTDSLRVRCSVWKEAVRAWGKPRAKLVRRRLDELRAADVLAVMRNLTGRCHELKGDRKQQLSLDLDGPYRLIFEPADNPAPLKEDGGLDWESVVSVRILGIEDTHD